MSQEDVESENASEDIAISWSRVSSSSRRNSAILGALLGIAVGEGLGLSRQGLARRVSLWLLGRGPLFYRVFPGIGVASIRFHSTFCVGQAILRSYQKQAVFLRHLAGRQKWYFLVSPFVMPLRLWWNGFRMWIPQGEEPKGGRGRNTDLLPSSLLLSVALQGTGVRVDRWVSGSIKMLQCEPEMEEAGLLVARAAHLASFLNRHELDPVRVWEALLAETSEPDLGKLMEQLGEHLRSGTSVQRAAAAMGWKTGIPDEPYPTVLIAIYAWLRHPNRFRKAVEPAILLGGNSATLGAITGGLAAIHLTPKQIPPEWIRRQGSWPHNRDGMIALADRLTDWPHGAEDLHRAPALPSFPLSQAIRQFCLSALLISNNLLKLPFRVLARLF